jgi:hypothetical protein
MESVCEGYANAGWEGYSTLYKAQINFSKLRLWSKSHR